MGKSKKSNTLLKVVGVTAACGAAAYAGSGYYVFRNAFDLKKSNSYNKSNTNRLTYGSDEKNEWFMHSIRDDEFIDSFDGLKLHALRLSNNHENHKWVVLNHGIGDYSGTMIDYLYELDHAGFNVLAIDSRGCGMSEGRYTSLGWNEHYDLISWINYLVNLDNSAMIALVGINVGASAVMNAVGDYLPSNVKCAVEDGGLSEVKEILNTYIRREFKVSGKLLLPSVDLYVKNVLHFSLNDISTKRQLENARVPMLFMHGSEDEVIPVSMLFDNYYACGSEKELYQCDGCGFNEDYMDPEYFNVLLKFINSYVK